MPGDAFTLENWADWTKRGGVRENKLLLAHFQGPILWPDQDEWTGNRAAKQRGFPLRGSPGPVGPLLNLCGREL